MVYDLAERFVSINGEGRFAGELAVFIRFSGCNLRCNYCDTMWANVPTCSTTNYTLDDIDEFVAKSGAKHVTITGGEPLLQNNVFPLFERLLKNGVAVEIETNGSIPLDTYMKKFPKLSFTMDYKMPSSFMESKMHIPNLKLLRKTDTLKLVCGSYDDLIKTMDLIDQVSDDVLIYVSPVFGKIEPKDIVEFIIENKMTRLKLQLQLHKFIWSPDEKGV